MANDKWVCRCAFVCSVVIKLAYLFDFYPQRCHRISSESCQEQRGTENPRHLLVENYRPRMNKLTPNERQHLRDRAMRIAFDHELGPLRSDEQK